MATTSATARPATKVKVKKVGSHRLAAGDYNSQVKAESFLRTNPERSQLRATLDDVIHERDATVRTARVAAQGAIQTARAGVPALNAVQADALSSINPALESSPGAARETDRTRIRLAERLGQAMTDLQAREQDATAGRMYAVNAANDRAATNAGKIRDRLIGLSQEEGAFAQQRAAELARQDDSDALKVATTNASLSQQERNSLRSAGIDPDTGSYIPGGKLDPKAKGRGKGGGAKAPTPEQYLKAQDAITRARGYAAKFKKGGLSRREAAQILVNGLDPSGGEDIYTTTDRGTQQKALTGKDGKTGTAKTTPKDPGVKPVSALWARVALDLVYSETPHLSPETVRKLHDLGYKVRDLGGFPTRKDVPRRQTGVPGYSKGSGRPD
jgi:hypothetical protein